MSNTINPFAMRLDRSVDWVYRGSLFFQTNLDPFEKFYFYFLVYNCFQSCFLYRTKIKVVFTSLRVVFFEKSYYVCVVVRDHQFSRFLLSFLSLSFFFKNNYFVLKNLNFKKIFKKKIKTVFCLFNKLKNIFQNFCKILNKSNNQKTFFFLKKKKFLETFFFLVKKKLKKKFFFFSFYFFFLLFKIRKIKIINKFFYFYFFFIFFFFNNFQNFLKKKNKKFFYFTSIFFFFFVEEPITTIDSGLKIFFFDPKKQKSLNFFYFFPFFFFKYFLFLSFIFFQSYFDIFIYNKNVFFEDYFFFFFLKFNSFYFFIRNLFLNLYIFPYFRIYFIISLYFFFFCDFNFSLKKKNLLYIYIYIYEIYLLLFIGNWSKLKDHLFFLFYYFRFYYYYFFFFKYWQIFFIYRLRVRFFWFCLTKLLLLTKIFFFYYVIFRIVYIRTITSTMESFNIALFIRRFLTRNLDVRSILKRSYFVFQKFKGLYGLHIHASGRFARRGRALNQKVVIGFNKFRIWDIEGDYSQFFSPLLFGVGCLKVILFKKSGFFFRGYLDNSLFVLEK